MHFRVLGAVQLMSEDGEHHTPAPHKTRSLLALLLTHANKPLKTEKLVDQLWDGTPPAAARSALQVYISRLRAHLEQAFPGTGATVLVRRPAGYTLLIDDDQLDAARFARLVHRAEHAEDKADLEEAWRALGEALQLWTAPALTDVRELPVLAQRAVRLDEARLAAEERRVHIGLRMNRHAHLVGVLRDLTLSYPFSENLHRFLMLALYRCGRVAEALEEFRHVRATLVDGLGIEPGPRIQRLHRALLTRDPQLDDAAWTD